MDECIKKTDVELIYNGLKEVAEGQMQGADTISMITLNGLVGGINMLIEGVKSLAPADVAPVVHARWEFVEDLGGDGHWMCANCGVEWVFNDGSPEENEAYHCPRCGAKMDGHTTPAYRMGQRLKARYSHDT